MQIIKEIEVIFLGQEVNSIVVVKVVYNLVDFITEKDS